MTAGERGAEGRIPTLVEIKADLKTRSERVPLNIWSRFFPDLHIPIGTHTTSPLLSADVAHIVDGRGRPLPVPHTIGHDVVETFLDKEGRIMEELVHKASDGYDSDTKSPSEVLGETSEERYRWGFAIAVNKLSWLERKAADMVMENES